MASESRPLLVPQNRKLRHLRGIYLRNLTFALPALRTVDDSELNGSPPSAKKGKRRRGSSLGELGYARSSESLRSGGRRGSGTLGAAMGPAERQRRLQRSVEERIADAFFSLHCEGETPVYLSEIVERASNFNFRFFDLTHDHPSITRSSEFTVKIWAKRQGAWCLLLEDFVDLRSLHFLGSPGALEDQRFPPNALIFHLADGMYSADFASTPRRPKAAPPLATSSYNAILKLANLDTAIQDALATHHAISAQINDILETSPPNPVPQALDRVALARKYVSAERRALSAAQRRSAELSASITARREAIREGRAAQERAAQDVANAQDKLSSARAQVEQTGELIHGQRRRVVADLGSIFRIEPVPGGAPLSFRICGLPLPNTTPDAATGRGADENVLSAALGHAALLTDILQCYLSTPLPYPVAPLGSRSTIRDDISLLADHRLGAAQLQLQRQQQHQRHQQQHHHQSHQQSRSREFPLYLPRGGSTAGHFRFEYAWFLLNKDVEALCVGRGLRVVDIRETLPNLKYLIYVCCAGSDEVPERKRGGVRGLWGGGRAAGDGSGKGGGGGAGGGGGGGLDDAKLDAPNIKGVAAANGSSLPFREDEMTLTLRTKGLRENVSR